MDKNRMKNLKKGKFNSKIKMQSNCMMKIMNLIKKKMLMLLNRLINKNQHKELNSSLNLITLIDLINHYFIKIIYLRVFLN